MIKKMIPDYVFKSIYDIDFDKLYNDGIRLILTDLDNTLISYNDKLPNDELKAWKEKVISLGFEIILVSNSRKNRVDNFAKEFDIIYQKFSTKPLKRGIKKAIKKASKQYNNNEIMLMGDQLMTDIYGAKRCKIKACLIFPVLKSSDKLPTRINRKFEQFFINRIKKKYPDEYDLKLKEFDNL